MLGVARVCAEFRNKKKEVIMTIRPGELLKMMDFPDEVWEDPYFETLVKEGSIDVPQNKAQVKMLECAPDKPLKTVKNDGKPAKREKNENTSVKESVKAADFQGNEKKQETAAAAEGDNKQKV